jgi:hypothetical protein
VCLGRVQGQCTIEQKPTSAPLTQWYRHRALLRMHYFVFASNEKRRAFARRFISMDARVI